MMKSSRVERDFIEIKLFFSKTKILLGHLKTQVILYTSLKGERIIILILYLCCVILLNYKVVLASYAANNLLASNSTY